MKKGAQMKDNPYKILLDTFGADIQYRFAIEEMSELTKSICKYQRKIENASKEEKEKLCDDVIEEIADVLVCAEQLSFMFGNEKVQKVKDFKIARALNRAKAKDNELRLKKNEGL